jgi:hypothetical protein
MVERKSLFTNPDSAQAATTRFSRFLERDFPVATVSGQSVAEQYSDKYTQRQSIALVASFPPQGLAGLAVDKHRISEACGTEERDSGAVRSFQIAVDKRSAFDPPM